MISAQEIIDYANQLGREFNVIVRCRKEFLYLIAYYPKRDMVGINHISTQEHVSRMTEIIPSYNWKTRMRESFLHELEHRKIFKQLNMYYEEGTENAILTIVEDFFIEKILNIKAEVAYNELRLAINTQPDFIEKIRKWLNESRIPGFYSVVIFFTDEEIKNLFPEHYDFIMQLRDRLSQIKLISDIPLAFTDIKKLFLYRYGGRLKWHLE